jgi:hypothetical protein
VRHFVAPAHELRALHRFFLARVLARAARRADHLTAQQIIEKSRRQIPFGKPRQRHNHPDCFGFGRDMQQTCGIPAQKAASVPAPNV